VDYSKGHPGNPMTPRQFAAKTRDCAAVAARPLSAEAVDRFTSTVSELESIRDVATLVQTLVPVSNSLP
jgi:hypothetical protein